MNIAVPHIAQTSERMGRHRSPQPWIEEKLLEADAPPQRKAPFTCPPEEKTAREMIKYFDDEDKH